MVRKVACFVLVAVLALASLPGLAVAAPPPKPFTPGAAGLGDPYYPLDGNGGYDVQHYDLAVSYDPATDRLTGVATISARATQALSAFNLDFVGLRLRSVTVNGVAAVATRNRGELTVKPKNGLPNGSDFTVVATYDGVPKTLEEFGLSGFIHTDDGAIVIGEPHVAATWFPANDHPRDKASFTFHIAVPAGLEAISNGVLVSQQTSGGWTTWTWDAVEPMTTYLAMMAIGEFEVRAYQDDGIKYWDAIDSALMADAEPPITPIAGDQFLYSQRADSSYKRLTRTIDVPTGGAQVSFQVNRNTEGAFDFLFVEARTAGGSDWTTLPDLNGHTNQDTGACPYTMNIHPFLGHYMTDVPPDLGDPDDPDDDIYFPCATTGTTGAWNAISDVSDGWETWSVQLPNGGGSTVQTEVSIAYVSDDIFQARGVVIDDIVVSTGQGTTSFEADASPLDGWVIAAAAPDGSPGNENTWTITGFVPAVPGPGASALVSFDRQPEILDFEAKKFGPYPFSASGGVVDAADVGFALENQTRPTYSPGFFFGGPNDFVVVHELAHQWYGDSLAVEAWQHIWLNEGFATYAEWLWSEDQGFGTAQDNFDFWVSIFPPGDPFWDLTIGDPGPEALFAFEVYIRGGMTLQALRNEVGDGRFFRILREWSASQAGGNVTTDEFIALAEGIAHRDLDPLFDAWLFTPGLPGAAASAGVALRSLAGTNVSLADAPAASRSIIERFKDRPGQPFRPQH
jgi:Peptidase family M1 domain/Peptidase M1 N-terminal domain